MPVTKSARKAMRQSLKKRAVNQKVKNDMKIAMKIFSKKIAKGEKMTEQDLSVVYSHIDKANKKNIFHKNTAARRKSLVARMFDKAVEAGFASRNGASKTSAVIKKSTAKKTAKKTTAKKDS